MIELVIGNSNCHLKNLPTSRHRELKKLLSYKDTSKRLQVVVRDSVTRKPLINASTGRVVTKIVYPTLPLIDKHGTFPTGLLYIVRGYLKSEVIPYQVRDNRVRPKLFELDNGAKRQFYTPYTPYHEQVEASKAAAEHGRGIICAPTGVGKSVIIAMILCELQVKTLIVVPSVELKNQLTDTLCDIFGDDLVGPLINNKEKFFINIENIAQLDPKYKSSSKVVIIDEFHRSGAKSYRVLNQKSWDDVFFKFGTTATPFRSNEDERLLLEGVLSKVIYQIDYHTAVAKGYIVPMEAYYVELPEIECTARKYQGAYQELVVDREDRNQIIADLMERLHEQNIPTLVLVKRIEHGIKLQEILESRGIHVPFANGEDGNNKGLIKGFNGLEFPILIGTDGVLGEGIDTKPCEYVILAGGGKSKNAFMQKVGRGFRRFGDKQSCKVIMFKDASNKWLLDHYRQCVKYLKQEYALLPTKLDL